MTTTIPETGQEVLDNGGVILSRRPLPKGNLEQLAEIVLCFLPHNKLTPYATWQRNIEENSTYWGHYFQTVEEATKDFQTRGKR